jgi:hypothetical protein
MPPPPPSPSAGRLDLPKKPTSVGLSKPVEKPLQAAIDQNAILLSRAKTGQVGMDEEQRRHTVTWPPATSTPCG